MRVGLCEDDASVRRVLLDALKAEGHDVVATRTGGEALRRLGPDSAVDVLVLDIGLPDSDGRDVCQALRSAGQHAPVLFLTALDAVHERVAGFRAGGDDYLGTSPSASSSYASRPWPDVHRLVPSTTRTGCASTPFCMQQWREVTASRSPRPSTACSPR